MRLILFVLVVGVAGQFCSPAEALDAQGVAALQAAIHGMCVQPDQKGTYLKIEGDLNVGATLKVLGVNGQGKLTKENWIGISQRLDKYKTDPRACAESILPILLKAMNPPKDCAGYTVTGYRREFDVTQDSPEMGGGHNQLEWCNNMIAILLGQHPGALFTVGQHSEHTNNHCPPFNCPQYVYRCTVHVKADPICN